MGSGYSTPRRQHQWCQAKTPTIITWFFQTIINKSVCNKLVTVLMPKWPDGVLANNVGETLLDASMTWHCQWLGSLSLYIYIYIYILCRKYYWQWTLWQLFSAHQRGHLLSQTAQCNSSSSSVLALLSSLALRLSLLRQTAPRSPCCSEQPCSEALLVALVSLELCSVLMAWIGIQCICSRILFSEKKSLRSGRRSRRQTLCTECASMLVAATAGMIFRGNLVEWFVWHEHISAVLRRQQTA